MTARPWPNRITRASLPGLKGFVLRPRMGAIVNDDPNGQFGSGKTVVDHAGWRDPFYDADDQPILEDGVNLGTLAAGNGRAIASPADHTLRRSTIRRRLATTQGALDKGEVDWRSPDGKHVISWDGSPNRYSAGGLSVQLYRRGKALGGLPNADNGRSRRIFGAAVYEDTATGTEWLVAVTWEGQLLSERSANEYVEEVWMRRFSTTAQSETTDDAAVDQKIAEFNLAGPNEQADARQALEAELAKWWKITDIDVDPLLPAPPDGTSPKVAPLDADLCPWLFNASGDECQTIRMITVNPNGDSDIQDFEPWDQRRVKVALSLSVAHETVEDIEVYRPSGSIGSIAGFPTLTGSWTETIENVKTGDDDNGSFQGDTELQVDWELTYAVDYVGDQEVFLKLSRSETVIGERTANWSDDFSGNQQTTWSETNDRTTTVVHDFAGALLQTTTTDNFTENGSKETTPPLTYSTGADCTAQEGQVTGLEGDAEQVYDEDLNGIAFRWPDLRLGLLHYVANNSTRNWSTSTGGTSSKSSDEKLLLDGASSSLQLDTDSRQLDPQGCDTDNLLSFTSHSSQDSGSIDFYNAKGLNFPSPRKYGQPNNEYRVAWDRNPEGAVLGSALLGIDFVPYSGGFNQHPYGHETGYVRYDGAAESVQALFEIQAVQPGEAFVCYPLRFIGA